MGKWLIQMLGLIPYLVSGIEQIHGEAKSGADKKQMAMEALNLSANAALSLDPAQAPVIQAAAQLASLTIDGVKAVYNAAKDAKAMPPASGTRAAPGGFSAPGS